MELKSFQDFVNEDRFPEKAVDLSKLQDPDGFWAQDLKEACRLAGLSFGRQDKVADLIFLLNMLAGNWADRQKHKK